jgi:hypothetical protein
MRDRSLIVVELGGCVVWPEFGFVRPEFAVAVEKEWTARGVGDLDEHIEIVPHERQQ